MQAAASLSKRSHESHRSMIRLPSLLARPDSTPRRPDRKSPRSIQTHLWIRAFVRSRTACLLSGDRIINAKVEGCLFRLGELRQTSPDHLIFAMPSEYDLREGLLSFVNSNCALRLPLRRPC